MSGTSKQVDDGNKRPDPPASNHIGLSSHWTCGNLRTSACKPWRPAVLHLLGSQCNSTTARRAEVL